MLTVKPIKIDVGIYMRIYDVYNSFKTMYKCTFNYILYMFVMAVKAFKHLSSKLGLMGPVSFFLRV